MLAGQPTPGENKKVNKYIIVIPLILTSACSMRTIKSISPSGYESASDFAYNSIKQTTCIGNIDALLFPAGDVSEDKTGIRSFKAHHYTGTHCSSNDFKEAMGVYCKAKGGNYQGSWCVKNDKPIFLVTNFDIIEKSNVISDGEWEFLAKSKLGFISKKDEIYNEIIKTIEDKAKEKQKADRKKKSVNAQIGDFICKNDDYNHYTSENLYYGGFVEGKENGKIKIRVTWHGRKNTVVKNEWAGENIIWSSPKGWFKCNQATIDSLP